MLVVARNLIGKFVPTHCVVLVASWNAFLGAYGFCGEGDPFSFCHLARLAALRAELGLVPIC